jgi:hypothetical protein
MDIYLTQQTHQKLCELFDIEYKEIDFETITSKSFQPKPWNKGMKFEFVPKSETHRKNIAKALRGKKRQPHSEEVKKKISLGGKGLKKSEETKQKMRKPKARIECIHCGKISAPNIIKRFHLDNCKKKVNSNE